MRMLLPRQYAKNMMMESAAAIGESRVFVFGYALRLLRVLALLTIWRTILTGRGVVSGYSLEGVLTYTLISEACSGLMNGKTGLENSWFNGSITTRFLRPVSLLHQFSSEMLGRAAVGIVLFSLPLIALSPLLAVRVAPVTIAMGGAFLVSVAASVAVGLAQEYLIVGIGISMQVHPYAISNMRAAITGLLSGALVPLALLPWGLGQWLNWLPFASQASAPLRIYIGAGSAVKLISLQCFWIVILWPAASWIWRINREKMVLFGG